MFGFGKTGFVVANEIIKDDECELKWVLRKSQKNEGEYASHLHGYEFEQGKIYSISQIDPDTFFKENYVDVIIDFSASSAVDTYKNAARYRITSYNVCYTKLLRIRSAVPDVSGLPLKCSSMISISASGTIFCSTLDTSIRT